MTEQSSPIPVVMQFVTAPPKAQNLFRPHPRQHVQAGLEIEVDIREIVGEAAAHVLGMEGIAVIEFQPVTVELAQFRAQAREQLDPRTAWWPRGSRPQALTGDALQ